MTVDCQIVGIPFSGVHKTESKGHAHCLQCASRSLIVFARNARRFGNRLSGHPEADDSVLGYGEKYGVRPTVSIRTVWPVVHIPTIDAKSVFPMDGDMHSWHPLLFVVPLSSERHVLLTRRSLSMTPLVGY